MVYKGKDKDGKMVAIKQLVAKSQNQERYHQGELDVIDLKLKHDNIVIVYRYFTTQASSVKNITIAMELCEAGDLSQYYLTNNPDVATRYNFMLDMAKGVGYLHNHGIVHRDLKPENVLLKSLDTRLICKISDFGISKIQQRRDDVFSTQIGSFAYMAPEMMDHQEYSKPVDVFALGLLFFVAFKRSILENYFGEKALIPGYLNKQNRINYFNSDIHKEKLNETSILATHFSGSEAIGNLIILMIKPNPEKRCEIEYVLVEVTDAKVKNEIGGRLTEQQRYVEELEKKQNELKEELEDISERYRSHFRRTSREMAEMNRELEALKMTSKEDIADIKRTQETLQEKDALLCNLKSHIDKLKRQSEIDNLFLENNIKQLQKHQKDKQEEMNHQVEIREEEKEELSDVHLVKQDAFDSHLTLQDEMGSGDRNINKARMMKECDICGDMNGLNEVDSSIYF